MAQWRSNTVRARTPGLFSVAFEGVSKVDGRLAVLVRIRKRDATRGIVETTRAHREGDRIGATGFRLSYIKEQRGTRETLGCDPVIGADGPLGCAPARGAIPFSGWEIGWEDDEGAARVHRTVEPTPVDNRCREHRGR